MTRSKFLMLAGAGLLALAPAGAQAERQRNELGYFLPRVRVGVVVQELDTFHVRPPMTRSRLSQRTS